MSFWEDFKENRMAEARGCLDFNCGCLFWALIIAAVIFVIVMILK